MQPTGDHASSTAAFTWSPFKAVKEAYEQGLNLTIDDPLHFDGVGFVPAKVNQAENNLQFGDLDKCRNKETGEISSDALQDLTSINSYCEPSPSGTGMRFIAKGCPPFPPGKDGRKKGDVELYQGGHYLTITGQRQRPFPTTIELRPDELTDFYKRHFSEPEPDPVSDAKSGTGTKLTDDQIICLASEAKNSAKFMSLMDGSIEGYPSQSEADQAFCNLVAFYTTAPEQIDRIFRRSKLYREKWERDGYREGTIRNAINSLKEHYNGSGQKDFGSSCPNEEETGPRFRYVAKDDPVGTVGVCQVTGQVKRVVKRVNKETGEEFNGLDILSDCALRIDTETTADGETAFTFQGIGAVDKREVCFTMPAEDMAVPAKFKAAVINAFGGRNQLGKLTYSLVQRLSLGIRLMLRIEVPCWKEDVPLLPGIHILPNVEYRLPAHIPALVYDGNLDDAKAALRKALQINKSAPLLVATILGAPVFARWFRNERFGLGIWGLTNSLKTSTVCALMSMWGTGYLDGPKLKSGRTGTTAYAATIIFASAGWLPQLLDNVKTVDPRDAVDYVGTMNAVLEGSSKNQGTKDGGLRESMDFACTPIVTGEVRPQETATTSRVPAIQWSGVGAGILREVQTSVAVLPVIGYKWLMHLATVKDIDRGEFNRYQAMKLAEFVKAGHTVAGRTATIYAMLKMVWSMLESSPFGDVFTEKETDFLEALDALAKYQGEATKEETEVARFMAGLQELMQGNPGLFMDEKGTKHVMGTTIGKMMPEGVWLLPTTTLAELAKIKTFTQIPNVDSMTEALDGGGYLIHAKDDNRKKYQIGMNGAKVRGWYVRVPREKDDGTHSPGTKNQQQEAAVPGVPGVPAKMSKINFSSEKEKNLVNLGDKKEFGKTVGTPGTSGTKREDREIDRDIDSVFGVGGVVPGAVPGGTQLDANEIHIEADLLRVEEERKAKEAHDRELVAKYTKKPDPTDTEKLRIVKSDGYRTQIPLPDNPHKFVDHLFNCGEVAEFQHWRAKELIERGVAEPMGGEA